MISIETIPDNCRDAAIFYAYELDFSVIPVTQKEKKPFVRWQEYQDRIASEDEINSWWDRYPEANVAIVTGKISNLIAIDVDSEEGLLWLKKNYSEDTGVYGRTARGYHALYRHPGMPVQNSQRLYPGIDVRGDGGYIVAYPSIHISGHQYKWEYTPGLDGWNDLIEYPIKPAVTKPPRDEYDIEPYVDIWRAVCPFMKHYIDRQHEQTEDVWLSMLSNIARSKDRSLDVAHAVSCQYPKYSKAETDKKYLHAHRMGGPRTCEYIRQFGKCLDCPGYGAPINSYEHSPIADNIIVETISNTPAAEIPPILLTPGGLLTDIMDYTRKSTVQSFPLWDLGAALCLLGTIAGQKICSGINGVRTNLYVVIVGNSGTGKSSGMGAIDRIIDAAGLTGFKGASTFTSGSSLLKSLVKHPTQLMLVDEIGDIIKRMKNPNSHMSDLLTLLKDLHTKTDSNITKDFAGSESYIIKYPHLSFCGATTPERFWKAIDTSDAEDGFLARVIVLESRHYIQSPRNVEIKAVPDNIITALQDIARLRQLQGSGNLDFVPRPIPFSVYASDRISEIFEYYKNQANMHMNEDGTALYLRGGELTERIALIYALSQYGADLQQVDLDAVEWADIFVSYYINTALQNMSVHMLRGGEHDLLNKVYNLIIKHRDKEGWISYRKLSRSSHILSRTLKPVIETLVDNGKITERSRKADNGAMVKSYAIIKE